MKQARIDALARNCVVSRQMKRNAKNQQLVLIIKADRNTRVPFYPLPRQLALPFIGSTRQKSLLLKPEMSTSQILLISQPRTGCHLLERILTSKQDNALLLAHPAQLSVPPLIKWMDSDSFSDGMPDDILAEYKGHVEQGNITWEKTLQNTKQEVCTALDVLLVAHYNQEG